MGGRERQDELSTEGGEEAKEEEIAGGDGERRLNGGEGKAIISCRKLGYNTCAVRFDT